MTRDSSLAQPIIKTFHIFVENLPLQAEPGLAGQTHGIAQGLSLFVLCCHNVELEATIRPKTVMQGQIESHPWV